jgi:hypothetical protein
MSARAQLRRYGNNLNQIARVLNAGGDAPEWLPHTVQLTNTVVARIDTTVEDLTKPTGKP